MEADQLAVRTTGLGGTDVVALFGEGMRRRIDVYREKTGDAEPFDGNERTEWGQILEPVVAAKYERETGLKLIGYPTLRRAERPWQIGTPDRGCFERDVPESFLGSVQCAIEPNKVVRIPKPERILEIKTHGFRAGMGYGDEGSDQVPDDKRIQVAWYMALMDVDEADLAVLIDTHLYRVYRIERDPEVEGYMLEEGDSFWRRHVVPRVPPPPDGSESFTRYLAKRFRDHGVDLLPFDPLVAEVLEEEKRLAAEIKRLEAQRELQQQLVQSAIGATAGMAGRDGKPLVTWKRDAQGRVQHSVLIEQLVKLAGLHDMEAAALADKYRGTPPRRFLNKTKIGA